MAEIFDPKPVVQKGFEIEERILKAAAKAEESCEAAFKEIVRTGVIAIQKGSVTIK